MLRISALALVLLLQALPLSGHAWAQPVYRSDAEPPMKMEPALQQIEDRWAMIRYELKGKREKLVAGKALIEDAATLVKDYPNRAEPLVWQALALLADAETRNDYTGLGLAKDAKRMLEQAEAIDPNAMAGLIPSTLGMLYYETPGWPLAFGDDKKAEALLKRALEINPGGQETNYYYGDYLVMNGKGREAVPYLERARLVAVREGHERADRGRKRDIQEALDKALKDR